MNYTNVLNGCDGVKINELGLFLGKLQLMGESRAFGISSIRGRKPLMIFLLKASAISAVDAPSTTTLLINSLSSCLGCDETLYDVPSLLDVIARYELKQPKK